MQERVMQDKGKYRHLDHLYDEPPYFCTIVEFKPGEFMVTAPDAVKRKNLSGERAKFDNNLFFDVHGDHDRGPLYFRGEIDELVKEIWKNFKGKLDLKALHARIRSSSQYQASPIYSNR